MQNGFKSILDKYKVSNSGLMNRLGIALVAAAVCMACAALIGKAAKKKLDKKVLAVVGAAAFVGAILAVILIARTPMPL